MIMIIIRIINNFNVRCLQLLTLICSMIYGNMKSMNFGSLMIWQCVLKVQGQFHGSIGYFWLVSRYKN